LLPILHARFVLGVETALATEPLDATDRRVDVREMCADGWI